MFCKYCGRQINEGETCTCRQPKGAGAPKMQPQSGSAPKIQQKIQQPKVKPPKQEKQPKVKPPKPEKQPKVKPPKAPKQPKVREPKSQQESSGNGKGLATASFLCTAIMLISFVLLRFVLQDALGSSALEAVYPYLIYILPLTFGMIGLLLAIFSLQDKSIKSLSVIGILVSAVFMAGIFVSMKVLPYEADFSYSSDDDDEDEEDEDSEDDEDKDEDDVEDGEESSSDSKIASVQKEYEAGSLDYVQAKAAINEFDMEALEDEEALAVLTFQETIEKDLEEKMNALAAASNYKEIMTTLSSMQAAGEDEFISGLIGKYEPEYILYLDTESKRLVEEGQKDAAVAMLEEAQGYVSDTNAVMNMLLEVQNAVSSGDYVIADSNSRYLTDADINGLTIQQVNYAKNEIYARHGRRFKSNELQTYFDSKSWYQGTISPESFNTNVLNDYEKKNAELLSKREFSMESGGYKLDVN